MESGGIMKHAIKGLVFSILCVFAVMLAEAKTTYRDSLGRI